MHDWTLVTIHFDWKSGEARVDFLNENSDLVSLSAKQTIELHAPRINDWGPSVSVSNISSIVLLEDGKNKIEIEMQSRDTIKIVASTFIFPS